MHELTRGRLWQPHVIVFVSSACTMIIELVAGRIIAPYVGVSLYTWTSIIGVVLAGISLGNYVGGRMADRWASLRLLGIVFFVGGTLCLVILAVDDFHRLTPAGLPIVAAILVLSTALFFLPSAILGMVSPIVAKLAVRDLSKTGRTVGTIYAASTVGAIAGTFATGFFLVSWFGTNAIVWGVALVLLVMGLFFLFQDRRWALASSLLGIAVVFGALLKSQWLESPCTVETNYFCIKVEDEEFGGRPVRVLILDRLVHSYTSLDDPTLLAYAYERMYADVTAHLAERTEGFKALFIGGGGYTFPRYMETLYPESKLTVIEIDPGVTRVAQSNLGLARDSSIVTHNQDARTFLADAPDELSDLIIGDAFNDFSVPYHLTTKEFNERVSAWLADDGIYMVNIIDGPPFDFARAYVHTLRQTFPNVFLAPTAAEWRAGPRSTFVVIGSHSPLDVASLASIETDDEAPDMWSKLMDDGTLNGFLSEAPLVTLTDQFAPVDQMLAPVFRGQRLGRSGQD